jgi:hypothetical protein
MLRPRLNAPCGGNNPTTGACANLDTIVQMATAEGIKLIDGTIPVYGADALSVVLGNAELDQCLRKEVGIGKPGDLNSIFNNPGIGTIIGP